MNTGQIILSRQLPKTNQKRVHDSYDDGTFQAGWWKSRLSTNNKTRHISKTIDGDDVVIDRATGLVWAADGDAAGCNDGGTDIWLNCLAYANALDFAGFTDWRVPNIIELLSLVNYRRSNPSTYVTPFPNTKTENYWGSTTYIDEITFAWFVAFSVGGSSVAAKISSSYLRCVRSGV